MCVHSTYSVIIIIHVLFTMSCMLLQLLYCLAMLVSASHTYAQLRAAHITG